MNASDYFESRDVNGVTVVEFSRPDVTDQVYIKNLGDALYHGLKGLEHPRVVVDLHNVRFLSSGALGMLIALNKVITQHDGKLRLANVDDNVSQVFKIMKFHKIVKILDTTEKAVKSLA